MPIECTCRQCGKVIRVRPFRYQPERGNFCSAACRAQTSKVPLVERACQHCGRTFSVSAWRVQKGEGQYCSRACRDQHAHRARRDPSNGLSAVCAECGAAYKPWKYGRVRLYCSQQCAGRATIANIPTWAPSAFMATCEQCGASYQTTPKATRGRFCRRACFAAWMAAGNAPSGEDSPNWHGGYLPYYGGSWRRARRQARDRDGRCMVCGVTPKELGKSLDVHHLIPFRTFGVERHLEANAPSNLVTLCPPCHTRLEWQTNWRPRTE
jgi:hypothetical protein